MCDVETCKRSCFEYLGYLIENGALCFNNECYCKEDQEEQHVTQIITGTTTLTSEMEVDEDWDYQNQNSKCVLV